MSYVPPDLSVDIVLAEQIDWNPLAPLDVVLCAPVIVDKTDLAIDAIVIVGALLDLTVAEVVTKLTITAYCELSPKPKLWQLMTVMYFVAQCSMRLVIFSNQNYKALATNQSLRLTSS